MKKLITFFIAAVFIAANTGLISDPALAYDQQFYSSNDILYYNPDDTNTCTTGSSTTLSGNNNLEKVYNYMLGKGLTDFQAAGVVGNIAVESAGAKDPYIVEINPKHPELPKSTQNPDALPVVDGWPGGQTRQPGWGLIQWTPAGKFTDIAKKANVTGPYDLGKQLDIIWWHMTNTTPTGSTGFITEFKATTSVDQATTLYMTKMEGPGIPHAINRIEGAKLALTYAKSGASGVSDTATCGSGDGAAVGNAVQTAINYAWPQYHAAPFTTKKPSYEKAVQAAQAAGKYVGGLQYPGVDCGGFVTRVMQDSGVDPDYNKDKGGTKVQRAYMIASGKYTEIHPASTADMKPGDIAVNDDHTYMYVGKNPGFESDIASASVSFTGQSWRAPMAGHEKPADPNYRWFRLK